MATTKGGIVKAATQNNAVQNVQVNSIRGLIMQMQDQIAKALPSVLTPERFTRITLTAVSNTPQLQACTQNSFLGAMMQAAQLGLEPNTPLGQAYLIPYKNHGQLECQFQIGYKGLIDLAYRSGEIVSIAAHEVYENDEFEYELGLEPVLKHKPALKDRGNVILYYAVFKTKAGGSGFEVASKEDMQKHAKKYSKAAGSSFSPWTTNFDSMAKKTVLKQCLKYAPIKTEFVRAMAADETIKSNIDKDMADMPDETIIDVSLEAVDEQPGAEQAQEGATTLEM